MSIKLKDVKGIRSEQGFENYVRETFHHKHTREWIIGANRGKKVFELINKFDHEIAESLILDLGCAFGGISLVLSRRTKCVIGVDINKDALGVAHLRAKISNRDNFLSILSSATNIPIKDNSLDLVLINGVLEWVPSSRPYENPESTQLEALKEVRRILKKQGMLLLAIENRYYLRYWLGTVDHHSKLRFVPVLPRKLADLISKIRKGEPYLNRTYSYFELKNLVKKTGFNILKIYIGIPDYVFPEEIVDIDDKKEIGIRIDRVRQRRSRKIVWGMINEIGLMKFFGSNFIVACQK